MNCPCQMCSSTDWLCLCFFCVLRRPQSKRRLFPCVKSVRPWWKKWLASWRATRQRCVRGGHCRLSWALAETEGGRKINFIAAFLSWLGQEKYAYEVSDSSLPHFLLLLCASGGDCARDGGGLPPVPGQRQGPVQGLHRGLWPGCDWHALGVNKSWSCVCHVEMLCSQQAPPAARWVCWVFKMSWFYDEITADAAAFSFFVKELPKHWCLVFYFPSQL